MQKMIILSSAAAKTFAAWGSSKPAAHVAVQSYTARTSSGFSAVRDTFTGAFEALRFLPENDRETARIYDDDGYCLYR